MSLAACGSNSPDEGLLLPQTTLAITTTNDVAVAASAQNTQGLLFSIVFTDFIDPVFYDDAEPGTTTINCDDGGSMSVSLLDRDNDGESSFGDQLTLVFNNCDDGDNLYNGRVIGDNFQGSGDEFSGSFSNTYDYGNLRIQNTFLDLNIDGRVDYLEQYQSNDNVDNDRITLSGSNITFTYVRPEVATVALSNYRIEVFSDFNTGNVSYNFNYNATVDGANSAGIIAVRTTEDFTGSFNSQFPNSGSMQVLGLDSSVSLTAQANGEDALIETDTNGDGTIDVTQSVTQSSIVDILTF